MHPVPTGLALAATFACIGCTFHSTATQWHGCTGPNGRPLQLQTTTIVGANAFLLLPFVGDPRTDNLVAKATAELARLGHRDVRVVETESANYWYAIPPLTWLLSPVVGSVSIEYTPHEPAPAGADHPEPVAARR